MLHYFTVVINLGMVHNTSQSGIYSMNPFTAGKRVRLVFTRKAIKPLLSLLGAAIILGTFIAKDARKDNLKELVDSIQTAENSYLVRADERKTFEELRYFERSYFDGRRSTAEQRAAQQEPVRWRGLYATLNDVADLMRRLDFVDRLDRKLPAGGRAEMIGSIRKEGHDIVYSGSQLINVIDMATVERDATGRPVPVVRQPKLSPSLVDAVNSQIAELEDREDRVDGAIDKENGAVLSLAESDLDELELKYRLWERVYYVLYAIGWIITVASALISVPEEKSVLEELERV